MTQQRFIVHCEKQPPFPDDPDDIIWRQPTPPSNPSDPKRPPETTNLPGGFPKQRVRPDRNGWRIGKKAN
jgi:hypothetical protein